MALKKTVWTVLILLGLAFSVKGQWQSPYFKDPNTEGVTFGSNNGYNQLINALEEITPPWILATIDADTDTEPVISIFHVGDRNILNPVVERGTNGQWQISIRNQLDYDAISFDVFVFEVFIQGLEIAPAPRISLTLENIFDNNATMSSDNPCMVDELTVYLSDCTFTVYDLDGLENNHFTFEISGTENEAQKFAFVPAPQDAKIDEYRMKYHLQVLEELRFEQRELYSFTVTVFDVAFNPGTARVIVEVDDLPNLAPQWTQPFGTRNFDEESEQTFLVKAIDGDTKINDDILYELIFDEEESSEWTSKITIDQETGDVLVAKMDRDALKRELFPFSIKAIEKSEPYFSTIDSVMIVLNDINDNYPEITLEDNTVQIYEESYETLPFDTFIINDIDLAAFATYSVVLEHAEGNTDEDYPSAFTIIPNGGYQETKFMITVTDAPLLDYDAGPNWRDFKLKVKSTESTDSTRFREKEFRIELINWNDEVPIFSEDPYEVSVLETIGLGELIGTVLAEDADVDDSVEYSIVGYLSNFIEIGKDTGIVSAKVDNYFDYEKLTSVVVQIKATDTLVTSKPGETLHTTYTQLIINVEDVNDETPDLRMPRTAPSVMENATLGTVVTNEIIAKDPDTTADLEFYILWDVSTATKDGQSVDLALFQDRFRIEVDKTNPNEVIGSLIVNAELDYEEYEIVYLMIRVTDLKQEVNEDSAEMILTIRIVDVNDNAPEFIGDTLSVSRSVIEASRLDTIIGTISAFDRDGPLYNQVSYYITTVDPEDQWVKIDIDTGVITVAEDGTIDCDEPPILNINCMITITDGEHETYGFIEIYIIDTNNKIPEFGEMDSQVEVYENTEEEDLLQIIATDRDRDEQFHRLGYQLDFSNRPEQANLFNVEEEGGMLKVLTQNGAILDREVSNLHTVTVVVTDNYRGTGGGNSVSKQIRIIVLDVNDEVPVLMDPNDFMPVFGENVDIPYTIPQRLTATDADEEGTPNSQVVISIVSIEPFSGHREPIPEGIMDAFEIDSNYEENYAILSVTKELQGYYGTWKFTFMARDRGDQIEGQESLSSTQSYYIEISPFNYHTPEIVFPTKERPVLRLRQFGVAPDSVLYFFSGEPLTLFEAIDDDGGEHGEVEFSIVGDDADSQFFTFVKETTKKARLQVTSSDVKSEPYTIHIRASDGEKHDEITSLKIAFVNSNSFPEFNEGTMTAHMEEEDPDVTITVSEAFDPKNELEDDPANHYPIYYFMENANDEFFKIDKDTRVVSLKKALDREVVDTHTFVVYASNSVTGTTDNDAKSRLTVTIIVDDINDWAPQFDAENYGAGITSSDPVEKLLFQVTATDPDLDDETFFEIPSESITASKPSIEGIKNSAFKIDRNTGWVTLSLRVQDNYEGYFEFTILAYDTLQPIPNQNTTGGIIYIIADSNRVAFVFENPRDEVEANRDFIARTLSDNFEWECYIDSIEPYIVDGVEDPTQTKALIHFIKDRIPIEGDVVRAKSNDLELVRKLRRELLEEQVYLNAIPDSDSTVTTADLESLYRILLIVVTVFLGILCVVLVVAFILRTRSLNRQLKAFSTTEFGSTASNLNRKEVPNTNIHSIEGSNPVINNHNMRSSAFDEESIQSDESDFIGFDDHPGLKQNGVEIGRNDSDGSRESINISRIQDLKNNSRNPMVNGNLDNDTLTRF